MEHKRLLAFDTRDKKPKLFDLIAYTVAMIIAFVVLARAGAEENALAIGIVLAVYLLVVLIRLVMAFFGQIHYNPYSYNTIFYSGFALFVLSVFITIVVLTASMATDPGYYGLETILHTLLYSARQYMLLSALFIFAFSIALFISNISLIRHEGKRLSNILGIILSAILVAGEVFLFLVDYYVAGSLPEIIAHELFVNLFAAAYLYFECMIIGVIITSLIVVRHEPDKDKDFAIVLGCAVMPDGTPTPLLRGRLDRAIRFYHDQKAQTGKELTFITSGGKGSDEMISESASMKNYLISQGIPEEQIIEEDKSENTFENMTFSKEKIMALNPEAKVIFSTTNYHVLRSGIYSRRVKMRSQGIGARTKWYFWPNAAVREFIGLLRYHLGKQIIILACAVALYVALVILTYSI